MKREGGKAHPIECWVYHRTKQHQRVHSRPEQTLPLRKGKIWWWRSTQKAEKPTAIRKDGIKNAYRKLISEPASSFFLLRDLQLTAIADPATVGYESVMYVSMFIHFWAEPNKVSHLCAKGVRGVEKRHTRRGSTMPSNVPAIIQFQYEAPPGPLVQANLLHQFIQSWPKIPRKGESTNQNREIGNLFKHRVSFSVRQTEA